MRLKTKIVAAFVFLVVAAAASVVSLEQRAVHRTIADEIQRRVLGYVADHAAAIAPGVAARRERAVLPHLLSMVEHLDAAYAVALDTGGYVVAHTNVLEQGKTYAEAAARANASSEPVSRALAREGGAVYEVSVPLWEANDDFLMSSAGGRRRLGSLAVGVPFGEALKTETRIVRQLAVVLAAAGGGALGLMLLFLTYLLRPIRSLTEASARIGRGESGVSVPILSGDELGELAASFNRMSADLAATTVSKDFLDGILDGMLDALIVLDPEGRVRLANAAAARLLGRPLEELKGLRESELIAEGGMKRVGGSSEVHVLSAAGERIPVLLSASPIPESRGRGGGLILVARDIRERKALEARMAQSEKLSAIGQLAAGVAHEINNPLGVILGFAQSVCRRLEEGDPMSLPLRSIERESLRCKELVQNLLTFSRQGRSAPEPLLLTDALSSALLLAEAQARVRGVELRRELDGGALTVNANAIQLQQVIINLCTNALDATPRGGAVTVSCRRRMEDGRAWARIEVRDTGAGIPEAIRARVFDPFFTTKEPGKGTGLGLSLVYELVRAHHGRLDFVSEEGRGTCFFVDLPLIPDQRRTG